MILSCLSSYIGINKINNITWYDINILTFLTIRILENVATSEKILKLSYLMICI